MPSLTSRPTGRHVRATRIVALALAVAIGACDNSREETPDREAAASPAAAESCDILTAEDVQAITGTAVTRVGRDPAKGLGGTCLNFLDAKGVPYLGVNRFTTRGAYTAAIESAPTDLYPKREQLTGLGDEATLLSGEGVRYLVARKGERSVVLIPLSGAATMSDDQLRALAEQALARAG